MWLRLVILAFLAAVGALLAPASARAQGESRELRVVQANVGNSNVPGCNDQVYKLCLRPVEERGATALRALEPDLVSFQEILPAALCGRAPSQNPYNLCSQPLEPPSQVQRLLGDGYAEVCDDRFGWDCIAARSPRVALGAVATLPVLDVCTDTGFTVNVGTVRVAGWPIAVTNAHPHSSNAPCRTAQLRDMFDGALPQSGPALVLGDFNLDPYREDDESVRYWKEKVPSEFRYATTDAISFALGPSQLDPTGQTLDSGADLVSRRTLDHVVLRGDLDGECKPQRIDGGGGMDHLAQVCDISVSPGAAPRFSLRRRSCTVTAAFEPLPSHLEAVEFRVGTRRALDRRAPFRIRLRASKRRRTVRAAPVLTTGSGPERLKRVPARCAPRAAAAPDRGRSTPRFTG